MHISRFAGYRYFCPLAALLVGLLIAGSAHADPAPREVPSQEQNLAEEEAEKTPTDEQRRQALAILVSTMIYIPPTYPPPDHPPSMVPNAPHRGPRSRHPHHGGAGGTPTTTSTSPEPTSVTTGLLGSGMACVYAWLRKRRARRTQIES
jgi:hypothetical protein